MEKLTYSVDEAAKLLGLSRNLCYRLAQEGRIPALRMSAKRIVIPRAALHRLLEGASGAGPPGARGGERRAEWNGE